uniref:Aminopeptidase O (putative) n=1 Tax=Neogobius melanostomus TaxID=47308 RepID=A0A8C6V2Q5_9GOBI
MEAEADPQLDPDTDDLPLRANTKHILVRHYVLDLTVHFDRRVISGSVVLFLQPTGAEDGGGGSEEQGGGHLAGDDSVEASRTYQETGEHMSCSTMSSLFTMALTVTVVLVVASSHSWESSRDGDFTLVLDCCDLAVLKVEEVDITSVLLALPGSPVQTDGVTRSTLSTLSHSLMSMPSRQWREQHRLYSQCSRAPNLQGGGQLRFYTDHWSLQVRKSGVVSAQDFPRVLRICYETRPTGNSMRWTKDQDHRSCLYTAGSPINNRALFPCQEPPVAMSTWQAAVRAPAECVVLMSGEEPAVPREDNNTSFLIWTYYVTMPMPASTLVLAVGHWHLVPVASPFPLDTSTREDEAPALTDYSDSLEYGISCSHGDYPCRFTEQRARSQREIPHRVFAPACLLQKAQIVLNLLPQCLAAAHSVLGVHPFSRLDVLIVPAGFSSLGMASPHIVFLSQSVLAVSDGESQTDASLCGSRLCHEIAHSWFGLAIGARDWTEEWISEGFATFLEDVIWAQAQQLSVQEAAEQSDLKALLRWRRLSDELDNSQEQLQILRPNLDSTGEVSESGSSTVKHALNPDKTFMQVHYLKGYFLLRFLASQVGEQHFLDFFRVFVNKSHGQLILSQVSLHRLSQSPVYTPQVHTTLHTIPCFSSLKPNQPHWSHHKRLLLFCHLSMTLNSIFLFFSQIRHRWYELVVKHRFSQAYKDVENFLIHDQAMGVYLYGELMVQEDARQQALARHCLSLVREDMDPSSRRVVEEMVL